MTARLEITRAQAKALAAAAKECGCVLEVQKGDTIYRVIPEIPRWKNRDRLDEPEDFDL